MIKDTFTLFLFNQQQMVEKSTIHWCGIINKKTEAEREIHAAEIIQVNQ